MSVSKPLLVLLGDLLAKGDQVFERLTNRHSDPSALQNADDDFRRNIADQFVGGERTPTDSADRGVKASDPGIIGGQDFCGGEPESPVGAGQAGEDRGGL